MCNNLSYEDLLKAYEDLLKERDDLLNYISNLKRSCGGRKVSITPEIKEKIIFLANSGFTQVDIAKKFNISQASVSNILNCCNKVYK